MKTGAARHNWKIKILENKEIVDECPHCGIQRRIRTWFSTSVDTFRITGKSKGAEFFVNGKWQNVLPDCKRRKARV